MFEAMVIGDTLPETYHYALESLYMNGDVCRCGDWDCNQLECGMTMVVNTPAAEPRISRLFIGGFRELQQYVMEITEGILDFEVEKGNWKYTYHDRMANYHGKNQLAYIVDELTRNPSSRRAVMIIRDVDVDMGSSDPACLQMVQYFIRDEKLDCTVVFRSNDACKATFMNAFALIQIQSRMAEILGVPVGKYIHRANSFHCYEKDYELLSSYVRRIRSSEEVTFDYEGDWKDVMDGEITGIINEVEKLKQK